MVAVGDYVFVNTVYNTGIGKVLEISNKWHICKVRFSSGVEDIPIGMNHMREATEKEISEFLLGEL